MKKNIKTVGAILLAATFAASCEKVEKGYLSDQVRYVDNPIRINRGQVQQTSPVSNDGSSAPVVYKLLDIRDVEKHQHADTVYAKFDRYEWTGLFDPQKDTTVELLNKKRQKVNKPSWDFNEHTGAFTFYGTSVKIPVGTYEFDIQATNEHGSKVYKNIATFTMVDKAPYDIGDGGCAWFKDGTTTSGDLGAPIVTIKKVADEGTNIILKIVDQKGTPFNPAKGEIIRRGDRSDFQTYAQFHPLTLTDTSMVCNFETTPFPLLQSGYGYLIYYRIPSAFVKIDPGYTPTADPIYNVNPRFQFHIYQEGTYEVTVQVKHATRK
ncbi:MAG: DUF5007 domain-containing protein [Chitinophaga sp.]|uniref:DUF5007 domain-containing protein n=1 Tax=Chitinophaga sp. TaxID=1869181 RepID=UPI001B24BE85|nr:DUF5007 domain-containing protein [Chitinophaga sp.]MBO9729642.1 DUF5007 domain-containing protein [Chitinophaga sp.]